MERISMHNSKKWIVRTGIVLALALTSTLQAQTQSLSARINRLLANDQLKNASVGIDVVEIQASGPVSVYSHNPNVKLGPASCTKLLTTAAAFEKWGPHHGLKTQLIRVGNDLVLVGTGDPGLGDSKLAAARGETITSPFDRFAQQLKQLGMTEVQNVYIEDSTLDNEFVHPHWPADQRLAWYEAPAGALNFNANCLDWIPLRTNKGIGIRLIPTNTYVTVQIDAKVGKEDKIWLWRPEDKNSFYMKGTLARSGSVPMSVTIVDPGLWTGTVFRDRLVAAGIHVEGSVRRMPPAPIRGELIAEHETPLIEVLNRANRNSLNMVPEVLCKRLGWAATGHQGTWANGTAAVEAYVRSLGVPEGLVDLADGSGLSSQNRIAARAFTMVLAHVAAQPEGHLFIDTLATPGEDGTLQRRFRGMSCADHVHGKTGHIKGVSTLSGYVDAGSRRFAFSILCNQYIGNVNPFQDKVVQEIYAWAGGQ